MIKVLSVFGTRPEAIKMAPVIKALRSRSDRFESLLCVSAQHREMLDQVLAVFRLQADHDLDLMTPGQTPASVGSAILRVLPPLLDDLRPDLLLVQGDTMTTFAAALAAHLARIPVGHVEAGLRTGNRYEPFPEEMNRVLTTRLSAMHFAPTVRARDALLDEGVAPEDVRTTGNTVIDALLQTLRPDYRFRREELAGLDARRRSVLVTVHRRESFGPPLQRILGAVAELADRFETIDFVLPVHPNPDVRGTVNTMLSARSNVYLLEPIEYEDFVHLLDRVSLVLTDSGGIQEEAPSLGKPVLVMRDVTERPEGIDAGTAALVGSDRERIVGATSRLLSDTDAYESMAKAVNPYGDGKAAGRIVESILNRFA